MAEHDQFESLLGTGLAATEKTRSVDVSCDTNETVRVGETVVRLQELQSKLSDYDGKDVVFVYHGEYRENLAHESVMKVIGALIDTRTRFAELDRMNYDILLSDNSGAKIPAKVFVRVYNYSASESGRPRRDCKLQISWAGGKAESVEFSVYHAFASAREQLEPLGLIPQCYGACPEVQVTGMAVDMGDGTIAYRQPSRYERRGPTVNIFDTAPDIQPGSVASQRSYRKKYEGSD
jgi:hypothetical protein